MTKGNYFERGERLVAFYKARGYKSKRVFAQLMGIREQHVNKYFQGIYDPMGLSEQLQREGCDMNWLASGKKPESAIPVSDSDLYMLKMLKSAGIDNIKKLNHFLNPETIVEDVRMVLADNLAKYRTSKKKKE